MPYKDPEVASPAAPAIRRSGWHLMIRLVFGEWLMLWRLRNRPCRGERLDLVNNSFLMLIKGWRS